MKQVDRKRRLSSMARPKTHPAARHAWRQGGASLPEGVSSGTRLDQGFPQTADTEAPTPEQLSQSDESSELA